MKLRATITGNLTKDAENFINKNDKKQCKFTVAVNLSRDKGYFVDCFLNTHLSGEQLEHFVKGTLCTFTGRYSENVNKDGENVYLNRTLNICDFYASKIKNPFYKNMSVFFVGYLLDTPKEIEGSTVFVLLEKPFEVYGIEDNGRYKCILPFKLSDKAKEKLNSDVPVFVYGNYDDDVISTAAGQDLYIEREIEIKDFEILESHTQKTVDKN